MNPQAIRDKVAIVGMGCCKFGENWDKDPQDMIVEAAYEAYEDAGLEDPHRQIEAVFCGAQYPSKGTAEVADALKMYDRPVSMVVNYCATGTDAFRFGVFAVACGMYDTVLVVGHSNTMPALLRALGDPNELKLSRDEYDLLMVIVPKREGRPTVLRLRF